MKYTILALFLIFVCFGKAQTITSSNFSSKFEGTWVVHSCDENWKTLDSNCVDTLTINAVGEVNYLENCPKNQIFYEDGYHILDVYHPEIWTRYDDSNQWVNCKIYYKYDKMWSDEIAHYRAISLSVNELKLERDVFFPEIPYPYTLRLMFERVK